MHAVSALSLFTNKCSLCIIPICSPSPRTVCPSKYISRNRLKTNLLLTQKESGATGLFVINIESNNGSPRCMVDLFISTCPCILGFRMLVFDACRQFLLHLKLLYLQKVGQSQPKEWTFNIYIFFSKGLQHINIGLELGLFDPPTKF